MLPVWECCPFQWPISNLLHVLPDSSATKICTFSEGDFSFVCTFSGGVFPSPRQKEKGRGRWASGRRHHAFSPHAKFAKSAKVLKMTASLCGLCGLRVIFMLPLPNPDPYSFLRRREKQSPSGVLAALWLPDWFCHWTITCRNGYIFANEGPSKSGKEWNDVQNQSPTPRRRQSPRRCLHGPFRRLRGHSRRPPPPPRARRPAGPFPCQGPLRQTPGRPRGTSGNPGLCRKRGLHPPPEHPPPRHDGSQAGLRTEPDADCPPPRHGPTERLPARTQPKRLFPYLLRLSPRLRLRFLHPAPPRPPIHIRHGKIMKKRVHRIIQSSDGYWPGRLFARNASPL